MDLCCRVEAMKGSEANTVLIKHWREHSPDSPLLTPHFNPDRLMISEVAPVDSAHSPHVVLRVIP